MTTASKPSVQKAVENLLAELSEIPYEEQNEIIGRVVRTLREGRAKEASDISTRLKDIETSMAGLDEILK